MGSREETRARVYFAGIAKIRDYSQSSVKLNIKVSIGRLKSDFQLLKTLLHALQILSSCFYQNAGRKINLKLN